MEGIEKHCKHYPCAVFEDCGQVDATSAYLTQGRKATKCNELLATKWTADNSSHYCAYLGDCNLGVAGNSNRALRWFDKTGCDHLCLCNDDLIINGDFAKVYAAAHADLGVGLFCFCDFTEASPAISGSPGSYSWTTYDWKGYTVKMLSRMTGIMMSITRKTLNDVGYFDTEFGKFGEEHCDYTNRVRSAGGLNFDGETMVCLDIEHGLLKHQDIATSVFGVPRRRADTQAAFAMDRATREYWYRSYYRPFSLVAPERVGAYYGHGMLRRQLERVGYIMVPPVVSGV
jgi:hypothetical protein